MFRTTISAGAALVASLQLNLSAEVPKEWEEKAGGYLMENISPEGTLPGTVVAGTSKYMPDYWYDWTRDAALVMDVLVTRYIDGEKDLLPQLMNYFSLSIRHHNTPNLSGGDGEPKFNVDGTAFNLPWGRPQNDGPALRALTLIRLANQLLEEGQVGTAKELYEGMIHSDLDFVAEKWKDPSFDLWEEVCGEHFYTKMVQLNALTEGAKLSEYFGVSSDRYYREAADLERSLFQHFDHEKKRIIPSLNRTDDKDYKDQDLDSSVILAVLHTDKEMALNDFVINTAKVLKDTFYDLYPINRDGNPGIAIGRYPEDKYNGIDESEAHPWFLLTLAFGEYYHTLANLYEERGCIEISDISLPFFQELDPSLENSVEIQKFMPQFNMLVLKLRELGDAFVERARHHTTSEGRMSEQFDRNTGEQRGAENLTWSYANLIRVKFAKEYSSKCLNN